MRGMEFLEKLDQIDPAYLAEAEQFSVQKRRRLPKWGVALAACLALLVSAGAALAIIGSGVRVLHTFTARPEEGPMSGSGYVIEIEEERFPVSSFTGELRETVEAESLAQYEEWFAHHSDFCTRLGEDFAALLESHPEEYPFSGYCKRYFATAQEAWDYIGFAPLKSPDMGLEEDTVWVFASGNSSGQLQHAAFAVCYNTEIFPITVSALMYTEYFPKATFDGFPEELSEGASDASHVLYTITDEDISYTETFYTTAAGRQCQILDSTPYEDSRCHLNGYLVADGILYNIFISHLPEDADQAMELLCRWADQL